MDELAALKERIYDSVELPPTDSERQGVEAELQKVHRADEMVTGTYSDLIDLVRQDDRFDAWPDSEKPKYPLIKINNEYQYIFYFAEIKNKKNFNAAVDVYENRRSLNVKNARSLSAKNRAARKAVSDSANSEREQNNTQFTYINNETGNIFSIERGGRRSRRKNRKNRKTLRRQRR